MAEEKTSENEDSEALEVVVTEETLPQEQPKVDHSKLYVWVADSGNDRIQKFDGNGKVLNQFGTSGGTRPPYVPGEFKTPSGIAVDLEGYIWVVDTGCHRIQKFDPDAEFFLSLAQRAGGKKSFICRKKLWQSLPELFL